MSLCKLLTQRKTKVGCLKTNSDESSVDIIANGNSPSSSPTRQNSNNPTNRHGSGNSDSESRTTRLSLCCAMTESSYTPPHMQQEHRYIQAAAHENGDISKLPEEDDDDDAVIIQMKDTESQTMNSDSSTLEKTRKTPERAMVEMYEAIIKESSRSRMTLSRSFRKERSVGAGLSSPVKYADDSSDESPTLVCHVSRRGLSQRLSADNLLASPSSSVRHSSPDSVKSAPEVVERRRSVGTGQQDDQQDELASMDSLARQALLAAQVLHLIPTDKARRRNFLQGRIAANSLLGPLELEKVLPGREVTVFVGTWNMNGQTPPGELNDFMLPECLSHIPDIIAVGTQESHPDRFEWEVKIQETVGPSHVLFQSATLGTLHLAVYMRRDLLWFCSVAEDSSLSVRPGTAFRTKGAVAIAFLLFGTSFLFITSHLTAHQDKIKERVHDVKRIVRSLDLPKVLPVRHRINTKDVTQNFDCVFWFGDLNFRLCQPREDVVQWVEERQCTSSTSVVDLKTDQLTKLMLEGTCLSSFEEGPITFPPTYKYDPGTQLFDTSTKQRTPAYTDRILFKTRGTSVNCLAYSSVMNITTSDHKPVWGVYKGGVRPGIDTIPLAAGLFNRDVYLEGIKRRAAELNRRELGLSAVCTVQ